MTDPRPAIAYSYLRSIAKDGGVLLFRGRGLFSKAIQAAGRAPYSHAALLVWWHFRLLVIESREGKGVRVVPLSSVLAEGADVELWEAREHVTPDRDAIIVEALGWLSSRYGWRTIARLIIGKVLLPVAWIPVVGALVRRWTRPLRDSRGRPTAGIVCSELVARCWQSGGVDLVPDLPDFDDAVIEPGDLPRGGALRFVARLLPEPTRPA